jgi:hypothetical protein
MTTLRDPFDTVHKKDIKNKQGLLVRQVDYVGWSQSADRLDDVIPDGWSFSIMGIGEDWVHGRLTIGDRHFENIGYAENADMDWKKEVLKDAASDAFKRCAALAGVARYLYEKDEPRGSSRPATQPVHAAPQRPAQSRPAQVAEIVEQYPYQVPEEPEDLFPPIGNPANAVAPSHCPIHDVPWAGQAGDYWHKDPDGKYCRHPDNIKRPRRAS